MTIRNLSSTNATVVNGSPIEEATKLSHDDVITIGSRSFRFVGEGRRVEKGGRREGHYCPVRVFVCPGLLLQFTFVCRSPVYLLLKIFLGKNFLLSIVSFLFKTAAEEADTTTLRRVLQVRAYNLRPYVYTCDFVAYLLIVYSFFFFELRFKDFSFSHCYFRFFLFLSDLETTGMRSNEEQRANRHRKANSSESVDHA